MSSLLLLRHGQASFGEADYDRLSPLGAQQAAASGAWFAQQGLRFDAVWQGPRRRHADTVSAVLQALPGAPRPAVEDALDEFAEGQQVIAAAEAHFGVSLHGPTALPRRQQLEHYDALIEAWARGEASLGEDRDAAAFCARVGSWLREGTAKAGSGQRILAVTSAGTIGAAICVVLGLPARDMTRFTRVLRNASLTELVFSPGRIGLMSFNGVAHLPAHLQSAI